MNTRDYLRSGALIFVLVSMFVSFTTVTLAARTSDTGTVIFIEPTIAADPSAPTRKPDVLPMADMHRLYLPLTLQAAHSPSAPILYEIHNPGGVSNYDVQWSSVPGADNYTLQQDDNAGFSDPTTGYAGADTSVQVSVGEVGTYFYRVQASNTIGHSSWSNVRSVVVTDAPSRPEPGHYTGEPEVSFDVTEGMQVCNYDITVPFSTGECRIRPDTCADVIDNEFSFSRAEIGAFFTITGTFETMTHAVGNFKVGMCGNHLIAPPSTGTWEASK
jgi:hypothetical protein